MPKIAGIPISKKELKEVDSLVKGFQTDSRNIGLTAAIELIEAIKDKWSDWPPDRIIKALEHIKATDIDWT